MSPIPTSETPAAVPCTSAPPVVLSPAALHELALEAFRIGNRGRLSLCEVLRVLHETRAYLALGFPSLAAYAGAFFSAGQKCTATRRIYVQDSAYDDFRAFQRIDRGGELTARAWFYLPIIRKERLLEAAIEKNFGSDRLRLAGFKGFADGSLGSSTAAFCHPYEGEPHNRGLVMKAMETGEMARWIAEAACA